MKYRFFASLLLSFSAHAVAGEFDCLIEPSQLLEIRPASEGLIVRMLVQRGDLVKAGQVLVELDSGVEKTAAESALYRSQMEGNIQSKESRIEFLAQKAARRAKLVKDNYISLQDQQESVSDHKLAEAELLDAHENQKLAGIEYRRALEQVRLRTIRSPIDGVVTDRLMNPGELADNRDLRKPILRLAELNVLHVETLLPGAAYKQIRLGQMVTVVPEAPFSTRAQARVKVIDRVLDAASGTFRVQLELPNPGLGIPAGLKCKAVFGDISEQPRLRQGLSGPASLLR
jgi:RND family efflux transporter MFP subunit